MTIYRFELRAHYHLNLPTKHQYQHMEICIWHTQIWGDTRQFAEYQSGSVKFVDYYQSFQFHIYIYNQSNIVVRMKMSPGGQYWNPVGVHLDIHILVKIYAFVGYVWYFGCPRAATVMLGELREGSTFKWICLILALSKTS